MIFVVVVEFLKELGVSRMCMLGFDDDVVILLFYCCYYFVWGCSLYGGVEDFDFDVVGVVGFG